MSDIKNGGPAFPVEGGNLRDLFGMTMRDYFAAKAMQGIMVATLAPHTLWTQDEVAKTAYRMADAMLAEREK